MISDRLYNYGIVEALKLQSQISPTYFYYFLYKASMGFGEYESKGQTDLGICHGEDVLLIFHSVLRDDLPLNAEESLLSRQLIAMYSNYSKTGIPSIHGVQFEQIHSGHLNYMEIKGPTQFESKMFADKSFGNSDFFDETLNFRIEN